MEDAVEQDQTHFDNQPSQAIMRELAISAPIPLTGRNGRDVPCVLRVCRVLYNAADWHPKWRAAAVYLRRKPFRISRKKGQMEAVLVVATQRGGIIRWHCRQLCSWSVSIWRRQPLT